MTALLSLFRRQGDSDFAYLEEQARLESEGVMTRTELYAFYGEGGTNDHLDEIKEEEDYED